MTISRRSFLKGSAVGSAASLIGPGLLAQAAVAGVTEQGVWKTAGSHWGAMNALVKGGRVTEIEAFGADEYPTEMLKGIKGLIYNPSRIRYPMVRLEWLKNRHKGERKTRGDNRFVRLTWDAARSGEPLVVGNIDNVREEFKALTHLCEMRGIKQRAAEARLAHIENFVGSLAKTTGCLQSALTR